MALVRWSPLLNQLSRWPDIWENEDFGSLTPQASQNLDVYETQDEVVIKANVAGVKADQVDVTFEKGVLWISAEQTEEKDDKQKQHYSKSAWRYSYKVAVPGILDLTREPAAEVENGVVTVTFKKAEASKPKKLLVKDRGEKK